MIIKSIGKNQIEIKINNDLVLFQSYQTIVAARIKGKYIKTNQFYSATTSKHISMFLQNNEYTTKPQEFFYNLQNSCGCYFDVMAFPYFLLRPLP